MEEIFQIKLTVIWIPLYLQCVIVSKTSLVPGQLNGPTRKAKFQVAIREGNYKMIWGQVGIDSPLMINFPLFSFLFHEGHDAAQRFPVCQKGGDQCGRGTSDLLIFREPVVFRVQGLQLYDLSEDPGELHNLVQSAKASSAKIIRRLKEIAIEYYKCASHSILLFYSFFRRLTPPRLGLLTTQQAKIASLLPATLNLPSSWVVKCHTNIYL